MNTELEDNLFARFPKIFPNGRNVNPMHSLICYGIETNGDGWFKIIWDLCEEIEKYCDGVNVYCLQCKSKYAGLRFYTTSAPSEMFDIIHKYEEISYITCESCGEKGEPIVIAGWAWCLCKTHTEEKKKERGVD